MCSDTSCITFTINNPNVANIFINTDTICHSVALTALMTGGLAPYSYDWSTAQTVQTISGYSSNLYSVTITDANGCSAYAEDSITTTTGIEPIITGPTNICGNTNNTWSVNACASCNVVWSNCLGQTGSNSTNITTVVMVGSTPVTIAPHGHSFTYTSSISSNTTICSITATITDTLGCVDSVSIDIIFLATPKKVSKALFRMCNTSNCIDIGYTNAEPNTIYAWQQHGNSAIISTNYTINVCFTTNTLYYVTATNTLTGCSVVSVISLLDCACDNNTMQNGGFENNTVIGTNTNLGAGATTDNWSVWLGSPQISPDAYTGQSAALMWGVSNDTYTWLGEGIVNNTMNFTPNYIYNITFYAKQTQAVTQPMLPTVSLHIGGSTTPIDVPITGTTWQLYTVSWTAPATFSNTLQIKTTNNATNTSGTNVSWLLLDDICINGIVAIDNINSINSKITIYPNPTNSQISIQHPTTIKLLELYDVMGRLLIAMPTNGATQSEINMSELPTGMYLLRADDSIVQKVVKQ
jgi:hypothetical protein